MEQEQQNIQQVRSMAKCDGKAVLTAITALSSRTTCSGRKNVRISSASTFCACRPASSRTPMQTLTRTTHSLRSSSLSGTSSRQTTRDARTPRCAPTSPLRYTIVTTLINCTSGWINCCSLHEFIPSMSSPHRHADQRAKWFL